MKGLQQSILRTQIKKSLEKSFQLLQEREEPRDGRIVTPCLQTKTHHHRFRKLKFLSSEDGTRVQSTIEVLAIKKAKVETGIHDGLCSRRAGGVSQGKKPSEEEKQLRCTEASKWEGGKFSEPLSWWKENEGCFRRNVIS